MSCFVFDLLMEGGEEVTGLPLTERKGAAGEDRRARAGAVLNLPPSPLVYSDHVAGQRETVVFRDLPGRA